MVLRGVIRNGVATIVLIANTETRNLGRVVDSEVVFDIQRTTEVSRAIQAYVISVGFEYLNSRTYEEAILLTEITSRI